MYLSLSVLLMTGLCFLSFLHLRPGAGKKWLTAVEGILTAIGGLSWPVILFLFRSSLAACEETLAAWAWDTLTTYLRYGAGGTALCLGLTLLCALTALWEKKYRTPLSVRLRSLCSLAASVALLALAGFFAALSATDSLPLDTIIRMLGVSGVLLLRGMYLVEALWQKRYPVPGKK